MKKTAIICFFIMTLSCENDVKNIKKVSDKQQVETSAPKKEAKKVETLTKQQFNDFFPDYLGPYKRFNIFAIPIQALATASYGSYDSSYTYSLSDGIKNSSVVKNFELSYGSVLNGPEGTEYIKQERNGYKTIAFLQPKIDRYSVEFIYKNRFKLVLEGSEPPDVLWSYVKKEDLEKLDNY